MFSPMKKIIITTVALLLAAAGGQLRAEDLPAAETILDRYVEVTGGKEAYDKIENRVTKATFSMPGQGIEGALTLYASKPNRLYSILEAEALGTLERGIDGTVAWEKSMMTGAVIKEGQEKIDMLRDATFDRMIYWREMAEEVETVGVEDVNGKPCFMVRLTPEVGKPQTLYYNQESGLVDRLDATVETQMGAIPIESYMSDYKTVDGIMLPHTVSVKVMGQERRVVTDSIEHNVDLPADRFALPDEVKALLEKQEQEEEKEEVAANE